MKKIILLLSIITSFQAFAGEEDTEIKLPSHLTWEKIEAKCETFSPEKRIQTRLCKRAENRRRQIEERMAFPFLAVRVYTDYSFLNMEGKDKYNNAGFNLTSKTDFKLNPMLVQHYNRTFKTYESVSLEHIEFDNSLSRPLLDTTMNLWDLSVGLLWNPWSTGSLDASIHYGEQFYLRAYDSSNLKLDKYLVPSIQLKLSQDLFSFGQTDVGVTGKIGVSNGFSASNRQEPTGNYDVNTNWNYGADFYARKQWNDWTISGSIGYSRLQRSTSILDANINETTFSIKIAIPVGFNERGR